MHRSQVLAYPSKSAVFVVPISSRTSTAKLSSLCLPRVPPPSNPSTHLCNVAHDGQGQGEGQGGAPFGGVEVGEGLVLLLQVALHHLPWGAGRISSSEGGCRYGHPNTQSRWVGRRQNECLSVMKPPQQLVCVLLVYAQYTGARQGTNNPHTSRGLGSCADTQHIVCDSPPGR